MLSSGSLQLPKHVGHGPITAGLSLSSPVPWSPLPWLSASHCFYSSNPVIQI